MRPLKDLGIVLYLTKTASTSYVDRKGATRTSQAWNGATYVTAAAADLVNVGASLRQAVTVRLALDGVVSATIAVEVRENGEDTDNPTAFPTASSTSWAPLRTTRSDTGANAYEHAMTADGTIRLLTEDGSLAGEMRVKMKLSGVAGNNTLAIATARVG